MNMKWYTCLAMSLFGAVFGSGVQSTPYLADQDAWKIRCVPIFPRIEMSPWEYCGCTVHTLPG